MHKYKLVEFQFDLEIERTVKRLRKANRNLREIYCVHLHIDTYSNTYQQVFGAVTKG